MTVFDFHDYKKLTLYLVGLRPKKGHGQFQKLSRHLNVSPVIITQAFKGNRNLTLEQALGVTDFFGFNELERDYYLLLVQIERAGTQPLRNIFREKADAIKVKESEIKANLPKVTELTEADKAIFYSHWLFSAIRLSTDLPNISTVEDVAYHFKIKPLKARKIVDFLLQKSLCLKEKNILKMNLSTTHIPHDSPLVSRHHQNWRIKGFDAMEENNDDNLFFSAPLVTSHQHRENLKKDILELIQKNSKKLKLSKSEELVCLNIDLYSF